MSPLVLFDQRLLRFIHLDLKCGFLDTAMAGLTWIGQWGWVAVVGLVVAIGVKNKSSWRFLIVMLLSVILIDALSTHVLKPMIARPRPYLTLSEIVPFVDLSRLSLHSFPSNHAANSTLVATMLAFYFRRRWVTIGLIAAVFLVCFSRVYVGVHYPLDVIAGAFLGDLAGMGSFFLFRRGQVFDVR